MDCPVCGSRFPAATIEQHVEQCLIEQDAAMARRMAQELNPNAVHRPEVQPQAQRAPVPSNPGSQTFPKTQPLNYPSSGPQPGASRQYQPSSHQPPPFTSNAAPARPRQQVRAPPQPQQVAQPQARGPSNDARVTGAMQSDIDGYNTKISSAHKQLVLIQDSLESFAHRISLLEMRSSERIVPPVEIPTLPPPRYMAIKPTQATPQQRPNQPNHANNQPPQLLRGPYLPPQASSPTGLSQVLPHPSSAQQDKRQRFFQTAQRFYNDKYGANSFFQGPSQAQPPPRYVSQAPPNAQFINQLPPAASSAHKGPLQAPPSQQAKPSNPYYVPATPIQPNNATSAPKIPNRQQESGITDMHMAQIESKWISMILHYPEDAGDLILGHLSMLFAQRLKQKKKLDDSDSLDANGVSLASSNGEEGSKESKSSESRPKSANGERAEEISSNKSNEEGVAHPISEYVSQMIDTWSEPFSRMREPSQETLQTAVGVVQGLITTLEDVVLDYYKELSVKEPSRYTTQHQYDSAVAREQLVREGVRDAIWPLFYDDLMRIIRAKCNSEDVVCNQKMKEYMTMNPAHLGIPRDYWLIEMPADEGEANREKQKVAPAHHQTTGSHTLPSQQVSSMTLNPNAHEEHALQRPGTPGSTFDAKFNVSSATGRAWSIPPYYSAIQTFKELGSLKSPESKLKCVVKSARDLVNSVAAFHKFHGRNPDKYPVGGDELLPIFTYIVIRSGVKNLISESSFMELCISDDQSRGEMGYILATLQTVIAFLSCLDNSLISKSVDSVFKSIAKEIQKSESNPPKKEASDANDLLLSLQNSAPSKENHSTSDTSDRNMQSGAGIIDPKVSVQSELLPNSDEGISDSQLREFAQKSKSNDNNRHHTAHSFIELQPIGNAEGSFFEADPALDHFDGSASVFLENSGNGEGMIEMSEIPTKPSK